MPNSTPPKMHPALMKPMVKEFMSGLAGARHILNSVMPIASGFWVVLKRGDPFVAAVVVNSAVRQIVDRTSPSDHIFVWGSYPQLYSFSDRRMATRFVSCTHLVGAYASRPRDVRDRGESVIPETWAMFQADWEAHPPALIIDMSTVDRFWSAHPMTRYPVLRAFLGEYRVEA